jgi:hypothetical protein
VLQDFAILLSSVVEAAVAAVLPTAGEETAAEVEECSQPQLHI